MKKLILLLEQLFCHHKYQYTEINHDGLNTMECKWCGKKKKVVKVLSLLALTFAMCGCNPVDNAYIVGSKVYYTITIDDCEYVKSGKYFTHKGNCRYCVERRKKEQEELVQRLKEDK